MIFLDSHKVDLLNHDHRCPTCHGETYIIDESDGPGWEFNELHFCERCGSQFMINYLGTGRVTLSVTPGPDPAPQDLRRIPLAA